MGVHYTIPSQSRFVTASVTFTAVYNAVTPGRYDFGGTVACQNVQALEMDQNVIYLIDRMSVGGNIAENDYLASIDVFPRLTFKRSKQQQSIYQFPLPIVNYFDGQECSAWTKSDMKGELLTLSLSGSCRQLPSMIGLTDLILCISLNIFAIDNKDFNASFRSSLCPGAGKSLINI